jgi:hypothetical protein
VFCKKGFEEMVFLWLIMSLDCCYCLNAQETLPEETDDFDDFRLHSAELIHDIIFVVGATDAFYQV